MEFLAQPAQPPVAFTVRISPGGERITAKAMNEHHVGRPSLVVAAGDTVQIAHEEGAQVG
jgi:hypothetical protein